MFEKNRLHGARVLACSRDKADQPVLLEHKVGKGRVYLLNTWEYPGMRLDSFINDILRTLAEGEQGDIAVESRDVFYSVYDGVMPSGLPYSTVYLVNHDIYGQSAYPSLIVGKAKIPVRVVGRDLRFAWVCDGLLISPHDHFVNVENVRRGADGWTVTLGSTALTPAATADCERLIQLETTCGSISSVKLDGKALALENGTEGDLAVRCKLSGRNTLVVSG